MPQGECVIYLDGDDVGAGIELHLLRGELDASSSLSAAVVGAVGEIADELRIHFGGRVVFAAGDEVLAVLSRTPELHELDSLRGSFQRATDLTISCGVGADSKEAAINLRMAKLLGKNRAHGVRTR